MKSSKVTLEIAEVIANGDCALLVTFVDSHDGLKWIHVLSESLIKQPLADQMNVIPASNNLVLWFNHQVDHSLDWKAIINERIATLAAATSDPVIHNIPVCYAHEVAQDAALVCELLNLSHEQLIKLHTEPTYQVTMLGFLPGFAYLQGNGDQLMLPRKSTPDVAVKAGSVAIANGQTGIYSLSSPGGWFVIGRTPVQLLNWAAVVPMTVKPLDQINFQAIDLIEFEHLNSHD